MRRHRVFSLLVVSALLVASPGRAQVDTALTADEYPAATQAAQDTARGWLEHVDVGAWAIAWKEVAPGLRDTVSLKQWGRRGARARDTLRTLHSRKLTRVQHRDTLRQGSGSGPAVLLQYHSTFGTDLYVETVLTLWADEAWQVAGYEIAPVESRSN